MSPKDIRLCNPMSFLGQIRTHRRDEAWSPRETFFPMTGIGPDIDEKRLVVGSFRWM
jgi:hypothetical protein